jgi:hypothetical protein
MANKAAKIFTLVLMGLVVEVTIPASRYVLAEDVLFHFPITGRYRYRPETLAAPAEPPPVRMMPSASMGDPS